jgi:phosphotransacetylase
MFQTALRQRRRQSRLFRAGFAEVLMKGSLHTDELLAAVVARDIGLRTGRRISHAFVMDVPTYHKVLIVTDAAINIAPTLEDKVSICQNAIDLAISLGCERPKVAILAAVETVNSKMPATIDAAALCKMAERGQIKGWHVGWAPCLRQRDQQTGRRDQRHSIRGRRRSGHCARA